MLALQAKQDYDIRKRDEKGTKTVMAKAGKFAAEKYLLESLNRIARNQGAYSVLYVNVSKLKPKNRHPAFVKVIAKLFDDLVGAVDGMMFVLSNGDFAILGKKITPKTVENAVKKLRSGLVSDPLLFTHDSGEFAHLYEFPDDFVELYQHIENLIETAQLPDLSALKYPIEAAQIDGVIEQLNNINISELVKHQSVVRIENAKQFTVLFQEFFVAVKDLSRQYDADIDLTANKWLFLYLTQTLDKKTISSFMFANIKNWPEQIGLNLNLSSVFSNEFVNFAKNFLRPEQKIIAEVQMMDVFNSLNLYFEAREILHRGGHRILIDATSPEMLHMLNIVRLQPDLIKIFWDPMMEVDTDNAELKSFLAEFGADKVILAKCVDEKAVRWGVSYGIRNFQGPYIDKLEVTLIRAQCPHGAQCSVEDCLKRRRLIAGEFRDGCPHKEFLEKMLG